MSNPRLLTAALVALQTLWLAACAGAKYETPDYRVVSSEGVFEIRDYPGLTVVSAPMPHRGEDGAFMKLFRYISGRNRRSEKIAMTTPVLMSGAGSGTMSFIVPKAVAAQGVPSPSNPELIVSSRPAARYAVLRYKGSTSPAHALEEAAKLSAWMSEKRLGSCDAPVFAYYNPPWTPGFLRRNEVLVRLHRAD